MFSLSTKIGEMQYKAPALVHMLYEKCHNPDFVIADEHVAMLQKRGLLSSNGSVPSHVKDFVLNKMTKSADGGISVPL